MSRDSTPECYGFGHTEAHCQCAESIALRTVADYPILCRREQGSEARKRTQAKVEPLPMQQTPNADHTKRIAVPECKSTELIDLLFRQSHLGKQGDLGTTEFSHT